MLSQTELIELFQESGEVAECFIKRGQPDRADGTFGFVRYKTLDECRDAIAAFNGWNFNGSKIRVVFARETVEKIADSSTSRISRGIVAS